MRWIAVHLPLLSLESFIAGCGGEAADGTPVALIDEHHVAAANAAAQALGVQPGLKRATALALAPRLLLGQADAQRDLDALRGVAHAALAFTPAVTLDIGVAAFHTVLLEVQSTLRCFGGPRRLMQRLRAALAPLGHCCVYASAPTAQGAALLARMEQPPPGTTRHAADPAALREAIAQAPSWLPGAALPHRPALQAMGLGTCGDLLALPRDGVARRFGAALLDELDRALGERPDPRAWLALPEVFDSRLELFARADTAEQLLHGASVLLARLVAWASAQHAQVRRFTLRMQHEARHRHDARTPADTLLEVALAEPSNDPTHLQVLLRERLAQLQLAAPTLELFLHCADVARRPPPNAELFPTPRSEREGLARLVERLQARLGSGQVRRLVCLDDHRPERQTAQCRAGEPPPAAPGPRMAMPPRPVWLLPEAEPLAEREGRPLLHGQALQLLSGPERIESGWWDAGLVERDYFIAQAGDGALVWVYRRRLPPVSAGDGARWFLQGRFG